MSSVQSIPLKALQPSPLNARRTGKAEAVEELAASISAHGLLQGLSVVAVEGGRYQVCAGGRRLSALKLLQKRKAITGEFLVPCTVILAEIAGEASLAENVQRVAMHPLDEVEAFGRLAASGLLEDAIAARFGTGVRHVRQRLALSALSPVLKDAFRRGEVGLEAARAFCLVPEHEAQERVFALMTKPITNAWSVRAYLTQGAVRASDRLARFVGLEAYTEAGGVIRRDLFEEDMVFLDSPDLLQRLATEKLEALKAPLEADGWGWVNVALGATRADAGHAHRLRPKWRQPTPEELEVGRALSDRAAVIEARLAQDDVDEAVAAELAAELKDVNAQMAALRDGLASWDPEKQKLAGCVITVGHAGEAEVVTGVVTNADQKKINRIDQRRAQEKARADAERRRVKERLEAAAVAGADAGAGAGVGVAGVPADEAVGAGGDGAGGEPCSDQPPRRSSDGVTVMVLDPAAGTVSVNGVPVGSSGGSVDDGPASIPPWEDDALPEGAGYTQKTMQELTSARTRALRSLLAADPGTGLALAVYALGAQQIAREGPVGLSVDAFGCLLSSDAEPMANARDALGASVPDTESGWFGWCMAQDAKTLLTTLPILIASTLDLSHTGAIAAATRRQAVADTLATRLQLDMMGWWTADEAFFTGLTKAQITDAILASPAAQALETDADREAFTRLLATKRKDELAVMAAQSLESSGWLPEPLRTAGLVAGHDDPCFAVTDEGLEALATSEAVEPDVGRIYAA